MPRSTNTIQRAFASSSDLIIEQTLMRSLKSTGRLTRGSGMTEDMEPLDLICTCNIRVQQRDAGFHRTDLYYKSATQRLNWGAHQKRCIWSRKDSDKTYGACSPFTSDPTLKNIVNGIVAGPDVNVYAFESVWIKIIQAERQSPDLWEYLCYEDSSWLYHWSCLSVPAFPCCVKVRRSLPWRGFDVWTKLLLSSSLWGQEHSLKSRQTSAFSGNSRPCCRLLKWGCDALCS